MQIMQPWAPCLGRHPLPPLRSWPIRPQGCDVVQRLWRSAVHPVSRPIGLSVVPQRSAKAPGLELQVVSSYVVPQVEQQFGMRRMPESEWLCVLHAPSLAWTQQLQSL